MNEQLNKKVMTPTPTLGGSTGTQKAIFGYGTSNFPVQQPHLHGHNDCYKCYTKKCFWHLTFNKTYVQFCAWIKHLD